jgi:perosamine synthetase
LNIPIAKVDLTLEDEASVIQVLRSGWLVQGPQVAEFEKRFQAYTGLNLALATSSCTTALHLALIAAGVSSGDEVLVPAFTWVATANVVEMQGARPVFIDIDLNSFNLDITKVQAAITPKTRALIAVSLFGLSAEMQPLRALADQFGLKLIEDAACALGSRYQGQHVGHLADYACFSFHPRKSLTTGEGGMLASTSKHQEGLFRSLRDHGASISDRARHLGNRPYLLPDFSVLGYNYRMTDLQAALGVSQFKRFEETLQQRRQNADTYDRLLEGVEGLITPQSPPHCQHAYQAYVCRIGPPNPHPDQVPQLHQLRNQLMEHLQSLGISTRPGTHAVPFLDYYRQRYAHQPKDFPAAWMAEQLSLALPLYASITTQELEFVARHLLHALTSLR